MNKRNVVIIAIGAGVAVLLVVYGFLAYPKVDKNEENANQNQEQTTTSTADVSATSTTSTVATSTKTTTGSTGTKTTTKQPGAAPDSYISTLEKYTDAGYKIQFIGCSAKPGKLIVKKGKSFMLDNRGDKSIKVTVGTANYFIGAYKYAIATEYTLGTNYILCNGIRAAEITVVQ